MLESAVAKFLRDGKKHRNITVGELLGDEQFERMWLGKKTEKTYNELLSKFELQSPPSEELSAAAKELLSAVKKR